MNLMETYKKEPGGKEPLKERNPKWLNDDYVKFIRMAQYFIEKNGEGILAFINPHGYLDNPTFRGMRWSLLKTYDKIYTINLHGNSKRKETAPDGSKDENVFDIMQGVSINLFVKTKNKKKDSLAKVFYHDLFGKRQDKYSFLETSSLTTISWTQLHPQPPMYLFIPQDLKAGKEYMKGFSVDELFSISSVGIVTTKDSFIICKDETLAKQRVNDIINMPEQELRAKYKLTDTRDWSISRAKDDVGTSFDENKIRRINYRPFDTKFLYYTGAANGIVARPRYHSLRHLLNPSNLGLLTCRQLAGNEWSHVGITDCLVDDCRVSNRTKERGYVFPLYQDTGEAGSIFEKSERLVPNFNKDIVRKIEISLNEQINPQELFDYIYATLHSPSYRKHYREFLKSDFPRIPYPTKKEKYHQLAEKGCSLRKLHIMDSASQWPVTVTFPIKGGNIIDKLIYNLWNNLEK